MKLTITYTLSLRAYEIKVEGYEPLLITKKMFEQLQPGMPISVDLYGEWVITHDVTLPA